MKFDVAVFGSAFVDVYLTSKDFKIKKEWLCQSYGAKIEVDKMVTTSGGGATNVTVGLERLGLQTACVACLGNDEWATFVKKDLKKEGVSQRYLQQSEEMTSHSTVLVTKGGGRTILAYRGASNKLSQHRIDWEKLTANWFYVSSLGGNFNLLAKIMRVAKEKKIKVVINPGMNELMAGEQFKEFLPHTELLILNLEEAAKLTKHEIKNKEEILKDMAKLGSKLTAITEGRKGAILLQNKKRIFLPAITSMVVEETGAGDAFASGLIAGLIKFKDLKKALKLGLANGASVVEYFGPKKGLLFEPETEEWLKK